MVNKNGLPGIRFTTEPHVLEEILPRMDIAAFVGFASSGPLNIPVLLEDMMRFRDIFGNELREAGLIRCVWALVRRLALKEGNAYVFQTNNENFRRLVQHKFERLLGNLYVRGAFAGDKPETAYSVVTDRSINTNASLDLGRIIVELRISPSRPMVFITVKLVQTAHEVLAIQEI